MASDLNELLGLLNVEELDNCLFRGFSPSGRTFPVFGGQVVAQSLDAATRTVDPERVIHSLHAYFLRPGDAGRPIIFHVDPIRNGKSFSTRRVVAKQGGAAIFNASMSFQISEPGLDHQLEKPDVPPPDGLESDQEFWTRMRETFPDKVPGRRNFFDAIDLRPVERINVFEPKAMPPRRAVWMRTNGRLPDDPNIHRRVLAYISDLYFMATALLPHGVTWWSRKIQGASLDHGLWFHEDCRADQWLLYDMDSPRSVGCRGLNRGLFYSQDGRLIASTVQEGLIRLRD